MPILNYTTKIAVSKTALEIQALLVKNGAYAVRVEYDGQLPRAIEFETNTRTMGRQSYYYAPNCAGVLSAMKRDRAVPRSACNLEQATRVAWRIEKDWLEAQFAKIHSTETPLEQLMMPYMMTSDTTSLFELMVAKHHKALPEPTAGH